MKTEKETPVGGSFTKFDTLVVKGAAILLMMWHHCFLPGRFEDFTISFWPLTQGQVTNIAAFCKICVSLFAFVSGFGLFRSLDEKMRTQGRLSSRFVSGWLRERYVRSFSGFWLIVVLAWVVCSVLDMRPRTIYFSDSVLSGLVYMLLDFLGLSNFFGTPSLIGTWWYMSAAFVFILAAPLLWLLLDRFGSVFTLGALFLLPRIGAGYPGNIAPYSFLPAFCLGMIFARERLFDRMDAWLGKGRGRPALGIVLSAALTFLCYKIAFHLPTEQFWDVKWGLFCGVYVSAIYLTLARLPGLNRVLAFLGKHSANIFMIHTFLRDTYLRDFIYSRGHFLLILLVLLGLSLALSIVLEALKKWLHFDALVRKLL